MANTEQSGATAEAPAGHVTESTRREEELRRSYQCLRQPFEHAADGIFVHGLDGLFTDVNRASCEMLGYSREELLQMHPWDLCIQQSREKTLSMLADMPITAAEELLRKDGTKFPAEVRLVMFEAPTGKVFISICRDITKRRQAEEARAKAEIAVLEERNRMAREIHDTLAQSFTGILLQIEAAEAAAEAGLPADMHLSRVRELTRFGLAEARRSVLALRPLDLEEKGLEHALQQLAERSSIQGALICEFSALGAVHRLNADMQLAFFRIAQEALSNAIKHAKATRISMKLTFETSTVRLSVEDDGGGIAKETAALSSSGYGLVQMQERAQQIGGTLKVESSPGAGTKITVIASAPPSATPV
jgi:PAS domain S-box-containing protein